MRIALVTTTINVPKVLSLYRKYGPGVRFFVAGDLKTPREAYEFVLRLDDTVVCLPESGHQYKCSELIGWNCIQRRNIALLEAIKWGADVVVSIDDDNIPLNNQYYSDFEKRLLTSRSELVPPGNIRHTTDAILFAGIKATGSNAWFDVGTLLNPVSPHRGFPPTKAAPARFESTTDAKIGVAAGICLGDPDISAVTRIANAPIVHNVSELLHSGVVVSPKDTWTVFNTQNTAFIRELAPAMFCPPGVGRYDDIYASLITQRVMRDNDLHVHFGKPFVWQQRNSHDLISDLKMEISGMDNIVKLAGILDHMPRFAADKHPVRQIYEHLSKIDWFPKQASQAALAFMDDIEKIL